MTESVLALFVTYGAVTVIGTCGSYPIVAESVLALFVTYGAVTVIGTCGSYPIVTESGNLFLNFKCFAADRAGSACRPAVFGTGRSFVLLLAHGVTESCNLFINVNVVTS